MTRSETHVAGKSGHKKWEEEKPFSWPLFAWHQAFLCYRRMFRERERLRLAGIDTFCLGHNGRRRQQNKLLPAAAAASFLRCCCWQPNCCCCCRVEERKAERSSHKKEWSKNLMVLPTTPISSIEEALFRRNKKVLRGILSYFSSTKGFSREKKEHSIHLQNRVSSRGHLSLFIRGDLCVSFSLHVSSSE